MSFQGFLCAANCIGPKALSVKSWITQTTKIKSITERFWASRIFEIDSSRSTYSYSFGKQPATRVFKNKNCSFPDQGNVGHHTNKFT